jgi:exosome complex component RRP42
LILIYSFRAGSPAALHGMQLLGTGDIDLAQIESLVKVGARCSSQSQIQILNLATNPQEGEKYALEMYTALNAKLKDEDLRRTEKARLKFSAAR